MRISTATVSGFDENGQAWQSVTYYDQRGEPYTRWPTVAGERITFQIVDGTMWTKGEDR